MKTTHNSKVLRKLHIDHDDLRQDLEAEIEKRCHYNYKSKRLSNIRVKISNSDEHQRGMYWLMAIQHVIWFGWRWSGNTDEDEELFWNEIGHIKIC